MRELYLPVVLELVDDLRQHLGHCSIYTFYPDVAVRVVGAGGGNFPNSLKLVNGVRELGAELETVVREDAARASPEGNIRVDENVSRALSGEPSRCDSEHVGSATEAICEKQDIGTTSRHYWERTEVVGVRDDAMAT